MDTNLATGGDLTTQYMGDWDGRLIGQPSDMLTSYFFVVNSTCTDSSGSIGLAEEAIAPGSAKHVDRLLF